MSKYYPLVSRSEDENSLPALSRPSYPLHPSNRQLKVFDSATRLGAMQNIAAAEAAIIARWMENRPAWEQHMQVDFVARSRRTGLFGGGERMSISTRVEIW